MKPIKTTDAMKRLALLLAMLVAFVGFAQTSTVAAAAEALPQIKGKWVVETMNGQAPPTTAKMTMNFIDATTLRIEATHNGETQLETLKYQATADGKLTIYFDAEKNPEGDKATWSIKDKKLNLKTEDGETLVLKREN